MQHQTGTTTAGVPDCTLAGDSCIVGGAKNADRNGDSKAADADSARIGPAFANRITRLHSSPIRDILRVIDQPGMISFAGGLPDPASFPDLNKFFGNALSVSLSA